MMKPGKNIAKQNVSKSASVKTNPADFFSRYIKHVYFFPAVIVFLCLLLYGNTFHNDYTEDDGVYTKDNVLIRHGFTDVKYLFTKGSLYGYNGANRSSYRPLMLLSFMTEASFFGLNPHVFQIFGIFYFIITCLIFYSFLRKIFKSYNPAIPATAVLLFIFHPVHTDAVANFKSRDEILTLIFGLLSFYLLLRYSEKRKVQDFVLSLIAFACSLLCKETSTSYLLLIPLILYFFTPAKLKEVAKLTLPFLGLVVIYLLIRVTTFGNVTSDVEITVVNNSLMAATNLMDRYATNFVMLGKYLYLLFIPYPLSWDYSYPQFPIVSWANPYAIISLLVYVALGTVIIIGFRRKSIYSFAILFYLITLFPTSNLVLKIACSFGERFLFSPSVGFCIAMPVLLASALKIKPGEQNDGKIKTYYKIVGGILVLYACILIPRNTDWKNNYTLFLSGVKTSPNSERTHGALGDILMDSAEHSANPVREKEFYLRAAHQFSRAIQLNNTDPDGFYNLGVSYYNSGYPDSALYAYKKTLELSPNNIAAANNLGVIYYNEAKYDSALLYVNILYKSDSNNPNALMNLGAIYQSEKNYPLAFHYDSIMLRKYPNATVLSNLSMMYNDIGMKYVNDNELDKAMEEFFLALRCDSNSVNAIGNMGVVYQKKGDKKKAKYYYQKALSKDPRNEVFNDDLQILNAK